MAAAAGIGQGSSKNESSSSGRVLLELSVSEDRLVGLVKGVPVKPIAGDRLVALNRSVVPQANGSGGKVRVADPHLTQLLPACLYGCTVVCSMPVFVSWSEVEAAARAAAATREAFKAVVPLMMMQQQHDQEQQQQGGA